MHNRRLHELLGFDYALEMYKPATQRRWGLFALPVLHHDRLAGKLEAAADRRSGVLRVSAVHRDVLFIKATTAYVEAEIAAQADWLGLRVPTLRAGLGRRTGAGAVRQPG